MSESPFSQPPTDAERAILGERLFCEDVLGFHWRREESLPLPAVLSRLSGRNEAVLRALTMLEEHDETTAEDHERAEFHRLEGKVNLVLELLSELVRRNHPGPAQWAMRFSADGVCWYAESEVRPGDLLLTDWYLLPAWPVALTLYARVVSCHGQGADRLVCASIEGASDTTRDWLEKLVFRRHRRAIAQQRVTRRGDGPGAADPVI
jgi:hypothetical protein